VELRHLRYFVAVAEELHFSRAAARLRIAQPALSQQIRRLEQELGVALFNRTKRHVELTPAGRALLEEGGRVLAQAERAARTAQRAARGEIGPLAIGFTPSADLDILPRVLRRWHARFPDVEIVLHSLLPAAQVEGLRDGRIHIGFVRTPIEEAGLVVEPIQREPLVAVLPHRHPLARAERVHLGDLAPDTMILFPREIAPGYYDIFIGACRRAGFTPRILHPGSMQTNLALVSAGLGVSLMPASIRTLRRDGVVYRPLAPPVPYVEMAVAYRRDDRSAVLPPFLDVLHRFEAPERPRRGAPTPIPSGPAGTALAVEMGGARRIGRRRAG
jgi:DNA-binding transcriptional LysR family regulator